MIFFFFFLKKKKKKHTWTISNTHPAKNKPVPDNNNEGRAWSARENEDSFVISGEISGSISPSWFLFLSKITLSTRTLSPFHSITLSPKSISFWSPLELCPSLKYISSSLSSLRFWDFGLEKNGNIDDVPCRRSISSDPDSFPITK